MCVRVNPNRPLWDCAEVYLVPNGAPPANSIGCLSLDAVGKQIKFDGFRHVLNIGEIAP
jgi:hypothetical protein